MKVLIIDDSRATRALLRRMLTILDSEIETLEAENGQHGLDVLAHAWPVDAVFVDRNMPVLDGIGFVKAVRGDTTRKGLKVMMVTSETHVDSVTEAIGSEVDEYLMKPFDSLALLEKMRLMGVVR